MYIDNNDDKAGFAPNIPQEDLDRYDKISETAECLADSPPSPDYIEAIGKNSETSSSETGTWSKHEKIYRDKIDRILDEKQFYREFNLIDFAVNEVFYVGRSEVLKYINELDDVYFRIRFVETESYKSSNEVRELEARLAEAKGRSGWYQKVVRGEWINKNESAQLLLNDNLRNLGQQWMIYIMFDDPSQALFKEDTSPPVIMFRGQDIEIVKSSKQYYFCQVMFTKEICQAYCWDEIAEEMGNTNIYKDKDRKKIWEYQNEINKKCSDLGIPDIFKYEGLSVTRLY